MDATAWAIIGGAIFLFALANYEWLSGLAVGVSQPSLQDALSKIHAVNPTKTPPLPTPLASAGDDDFFEAVGHVRALVKYFEGAGNAIGSSKANELGQLLFAPIKPIMVPATSEKISL